MEELKNIKNLLGQLKGKQATLVNCRETWSLIGKGETFRDMVVDLSEWVKNNPYSAIL